jgi:hypothetical protein
LQVKRGLNAHDKIAQLEAWFRPIEPLTKRCVLNAYDNKR